MKPLKTLFNLGAPGPTIQRETQMEPNKITPEPRKSPYFLENFRFSDTPKLSRQERRALERRQRKHDRRAILSLVKLQRQREKQGDPNA